MTRAATSIDCSLGWASFSSGPPPGSLNAPYGKCGKLHNVGSPTQSDLYPHTQSSDVPAIGNGSLPVSSSVTALLYGLVWVVCSPPAQDPVEQFCLYSSCMSSGGRILLVTLVGLMCQSSPFHCAAQLVPCFQFFGQMVESIKAHVCLFSLR